MRKGRLYLMRHGEAQSQEKDANLSDRGKFQAKLAALRLVDELWETKMLVEFYYSPASRAVQTHDVMREAIQHQPFQRMFTGNFQADERIQAGGVISPLQKKGLPYQQIVGHWLRNPDCLPDKDPKTIANRVMGLVDESLNQLKTWNKAIIAITHEIPMAAILNQYLELDPDSCQAANCEWIRIEVGDDDLRLATFRNRSYPLL